ncbi:probable peptidylglycine alpha-hydroxylating monooxygenase 1 [Aplysia californica]|uniref:peptidylglycine monooxygenase n=1 Tax=Aplysia californica TaxID=6500 RepID=A0ABM1ABJ2_APLCA|nr:probable peptidylglycine alpha-hydroxylating monooxygenase 1 [Aplysia californica]
MVGASFAALVVTICVGVVHPAPTSETTETIDMLMPNVKPQTPDTYLCQSFKIEDAHRYITGFIPNADAKIAHHILLYGCTEPGAEPGEVWNCGEMVSTNSDYNKGQVCNEGSNILYAWAMDAPRLTLPPDVGFDVGQDTDIKYLVVQVHYKNVTKFLAPQNGEDNSGLSLETTKVPTKKQAGVYLMVTGGYIAPHTVDYFETACPFQENIEIVPFAFRTHAHSLGRVISGYRVRDGEWAEIGRKDPRLPEMFYNVTTQGLTIKKGDILAARCTMENGLDHEVAIGATQKDEMCNFYVMYYVNKPPILSQHTCFKPGPPYWFWTDYPDQEAINVDNVPDTASVIPGPEKLLVRNGTTPWYPESQQMAGMPGEFEDSSVDDVVETAIRDMDPDELLFLVQELAEEEEEEEERERAWQQRQFLRQRQIQRGGPIDSYQPLY